MDKYRVNGESLTNIANTIREKYNITDVLCFPDDFAEIIFNHAICPRSNTEDFIEGNMTEVMSNATKVRPFAFCNSVSEFFGNS